MGFCAQCRGSNKSTKRRMQTIWELVQFVQHQPRKMPMLSLRKKLKKICHTVEIPVVAIGGIKKENIKTLEGTDVDGVAVVSAIFAAKDIKKDNKTAEKPRRGDEAEIEQNTRSL